MFKINKNEPKNGYTNKNSDKLTFFKAVFAYEKKCWKGSVTAFLNQFETIL
jgi:hypothetical protein